MKSKEHLQNYSKNSPDDGHDDDDDAMMSTKTGGKKRFAVVGKLKQTSRLIIRISIK